MSERPEVRRIMRRYARAQRVERLFRRRRSLEDDALLVVLEWGPAMRLPEAWRLAQRQPGASADHREAALAQAHAVTHAAHVLTAEAWPHDRREIAGEVDRVAESARETLALRYPHLDRGSLRRAVNQANYAHAK